MKIKHSKSYYVYQVFNTIILTLVTLSCIFPILHVFAMSLSDSTAAMAGRVTFFPVDFSLAAYEYLIKKKDFFHSVAISGGRVVIGTAFNMILIVLTAYPLARPTSQFRGRTAYMIYFAITMFLGGGLIPINYAMVTAGYGCKTYTATDLKELKAALEDAKRQTVSTLIDIKVLPKTMTDGYGSWWNVGLASTARSEKQKAAYDQLLANRAKARKY